MNKRILLLLVGLWVQQAAFAQKKDYLLTLRTNFGTMHLILYQETPLHKANFIKLVNQKFYDGLLFHRIIDGFMIQGGDPNSKAAQPGSRLGNGGGDMARIPFEFQSNRIHKKGALAAARDNNPEKKSSACQFYIVQGKKLSDDEITIVSQKNAMNYTTEQRAQYMILGGTPRLDNNYTVFGEVLDNLSVIDSIASQARDKFDRPLKDIQMSISYKKMRKKKIEKKYSFKY